MTIQMTINTEEGSKSYTFNSFEEASTFIEAEWRESSKAKNKQDE